MPDRQISRGALKLISAKEIVKKKMGPSASSAFTLMVPYQNLYYRELIKIASFD